MNINALSTLAVSLIIAGCTAESIPSKWQQTMSGVDGLYQAKLDCKTPPTTGSFQECQVAFTNPAGEAVKLEAVQIEGGMPAHGHGLPTAPAMYAQNTPGSYRIEGLKYSMHGAWLLGFRVDGQAGTDKIIFDFVI